MTHELRNIFKNYALANKQGIKTVLATVVGLEGSSYRKPGVRMLIWESGFMLGAVSGGCVEKEVLKQAHSVFKTNIAKVMTYDGRYRLGCEGVIYILIEPFRPSSNLINQFQHLLIERVHFKVCSCYEKRVSESSQFGSVLNLTNGEQLPFSEGKETIINSKNVFIQKMTPCNRLLLIGAEHDAVELCKVAAFSGWEVSIICSVSNPKTMQDFLGAKEVLAIPTDGLKSLEMDDQTAVVLMSHNYATDLKNLIAIKAKKPFYIGVLGAKKRTEKLLDELLNFCPEVEETFLEKIHGPVGLDVGAITPQEIAISIMAEVLAVLRKKKTAISANTINQKK